MSKNRPSPDISETIISRDIHVKGDLSSDNDIWIDGHVEGGVTTKGLLTLEQNGRIEGDIRARSVHINGHAHGNIYADESLTCATAAIIRGDIEAPNLTVESGATINGAVKTGFDEEHNTEEE